MLTVTDGNPDRGTKVRIETIALSDYRLYNKYFLSVQEMASKLESATSGLRTVQTELNTTRSVFDIDVLCVLFIVCFGSLFQMTYLFHIFPLYFNRLLRVL